MLLHDLAKNNLIECPKWMPDNTASLMMVGSVAYGVSVDTSDVDLYGWCFPPKDMAFPHLAGEIPGFGKQIQRFETWQQHHIVAPDRQKTYDFQVYSIVRYFQLCMENNPNMISSLFVPRRCIVHSTAVSEMVRDRRREFLHKGAWHKFKGYSYAQMHKIRGKTTASNPKRAESIREVGYDVKFAYHVVRLLAEVEQILIEGDLDLERNREQLKAIRRGEWTLEQLEEYFTTKETALETVYANSTLQHSPDEAKIKALLIECLEQHYGSLDKAITKDKSSGQLVRELDAVLERFRGA